MGFFDKAKHFMGGHGVKVEIVTIERQAPSEARMPMTDTVVKGTCRIITEKPCNVLSHKFEFVLKHKNKEGIEQEQVIATELHDEKDDKLGGGIKWPYDLAANTPIDDSFIMIMNENIPTVVRNLGYTNTVDAINTGAVKFFLRATADVKGSPFDPKGEAELKIVP